jgi:hypothetical protein
MALLAAFAAAAGNASAVVQPCTHHHNLPSSGLGRQSGGRCLARQTPPAG